MSIVIRAHKGYDYRDDPDDQRGCHGMDLTFSVISPKTALPWAITLELSTFWMSRPLATRGVRIGPQVRRRLPGVDGVDGHDPSPRVLICIPETATVGPDWYSSNGPADCPYLKGPCKGDIGYSVGDHAFRALLEGGEGALEAWLRETAGEWLKPQSATT